jgi:Dioxygenase
MKRSLYRALFVLMLVPPMLSFPESPDLSASYTAPVTASGPLLILTGRVLDRGGSPVPAALVEIWQTDAEGIYDHPGEREREYRDRGFQFYGGSKADGNGRYSFRTLLPGNYGSRPRHIHVKVKNGGAEALTTQLYFDSSGTPGDLVPGLSCLVSGDWTEYAVAEFDFILPLAEGPLVPTRSQAEGPYYPAEDLSLYDNDLASVR